MTATPAPSDEALLAAARSGQRRALARLLTKVEAGEGEAILHALRAHTRGAHLIGLTGPPGTGKSTLAARMAQELRRRGQTVAIVAVDPSSPLTGGAMLGDRVRMAELAADEGIFVRSMASRGTGGGLAEHTATVAAVLAAAGFQAVLIETVGTGQDEHAVANTAQTTIVITAPGLGDEIQALKAGILELADILVVNQADRDGADQLVAALTLASPRPRAAGSSEFRVPGSESTAHSEPGTRNPELTWRPPILKAVATRGEGVPQLVDAVMQHRAWSERSGASAIRGRALAERLIIRSAAQKAVRRAEQEARRSERWARLVDQVVAGRLSPAAAADQLLTPDERCAEGAP